SRYILMNAPNEKIKDIINVLPGMRSPTVLPLAEKGWSSIHTVIEKNKFWNVIDELKAMGAEGILVIPIEKMVL
ncbi:MAG: ATP phosphoribosyltransferase, partial [Flavobacteriaceae bacterium]|nr:ATP phosphoribosyltransferase [Flavobacteriaceae bacterium]